MTHMQETDAINRLHKSGDDFRLVCPANLLYGFRLVADSGVD